MYVCDSMYVYVYVCICAIAICYEGLCNIFNTTRRVVTS